MGDPVTVGALVASALGTAATVVIKTGVAEAIKDAYQALKTKVSSWSKGDAEAVESDPTSLGRRANLRRSSIANRRPSRIWYSIWLRLSLLR